MTKMLTEAQDRMRTNIIKDLKLARRVVVGMDCWSKQSLTASYLAVSASFFHPARHVPVHILLSLHQISHPHTGIMLADKLTETLAECGIDRSHILAVVTDNGSNMLKAVRLANEELEEHEAGSDSDDEEENDEADEISAEANDAEMDRNLQRFPCLAHTLQLVLRAWKACTIHKSNHQSPVHGEVHQDFFSGTREIDSIVWTERRKGLHNQMELNTLGN